MIKSCLIDISISSTTVVLGTKKSFTDSICLNINFAGRQNLVEPKTVFCQVCTLLSLVVQILMGNTENMNNTTATSSKFRFTMTTNSLAQLDRTAAVPDIEFYTAYELFGLKEVPSSKPKN